MCDVQINLKENWPVSNLCVLYLCCTILLLRLLNISTPITFSTELKGLITTHHFFIGQSSSMVQNIIGVGVIIIVYVIYCRLQSVRWQVSKYLFVSLLLYNMFPNLGWLLWICWPCPFGPRFSLLMSCTEPSDLWVPWLALQGWWSSLGLGILLPTCCCSLGDHTLLLSFSWCLHTHHLKCFLADPSSHLARSSCIVECGIWNTLKISFKEDCVHAVDGLLSCL